MKKSGRKFVAVISAVCLLSMAGCGFEGGRNVKSKNAVEDAIQGQIAAEEQKTSVATETVTESTTIEVDTGSVQESISTEEPLTESETEKKAERTPEDDRKLLDEIHAAYQDTADMSVDIDLTAMDGDMVYATVYQMIYGDPEAYVGKTFKAAGTLTVATSNVTNLYYPYVLIKDALACCQQGVEFQVFADETRPLLQGARLTAFELVNAGIDDTVICDNMVSLLMKQGRIQAVLVGCDRVAANGDAANKIGTSGVAILAKYYGIPFYVLGPYSTIDPETSTGDDIEIEERDPEEIKTMWYEKPMAPAGAKCFNPAFDVTDHSLITAIITDRGILRPPYTESIAEALKTPGDK